MSRFIAILTLAALATSTAPVAARAADATIPTYTILVPAGTSVPVHVVGQISSGSVKEGDVVQIAVAKDVVINHMIVIPKGSGGQAEITESDSAGGNGHGGSLGLKFDYVFSVDGGKIALADTEQKQVEGDRTGAKETANIVGVATLGIAGLFAHNFAHGHQKTIDEKTVFTAFMASTVHVQASERVQDDHYDS